MRRVPQLVEFFFIFLVMGAVGFGVRAWWDGGPVEHAGWCCVARGQSCTASDNLTSCRADGGSIFDISQSVCTTVCTSIR